MRFLQIFSQLLLPTSHASFNSKWGNKLAYVVNFDDADGNHYKTFTTSKHFMDKVRSSVGNPMLVGFTIAGYETSRGRNINRIKCAKCA